MVIKATSDNHPLFKADIVFEAVPCVEGGVGLRCEEGGATGLEDGINGREGVPKNLQSKKSNGGGVTDES